MSDLLKEIFDEHYYLAQSPSLKTAAISPLEHYQTTGWRDGRNPHPLFDTAWYLKNNADVAALGCEPLEHYCSDGWRKGLSPGPLFDSKWYLRAYQDVAESGVEPLGHYLRYGIREGRFPRSIDKELAGLSDRDFARWADRHCTRFLSQTTEEQRLHPDRETAINDLREALAAAAVELPPKVSIIVAARDRVTSTITSVTAILLSKPRSPFEIVVVAEAGNDESRSIFAKLPRPIRYLSLERNQDSSGYLNAAAEYASGTHLVFLDGDTIVFPGWLDSLIETLQEQRDAGLVGSEMLSANGRLLEAGRVVLSDGRQVRFGHDDAPSCSKYRYLREVDCCSWQSFAIAKDFWMELDGFDEEVRSRLLRRRRSLFPRQAEEQKGLLSAIFKASSFWRNRFVFKTKRSEPERTSRAQPFKVLRSVVTDSSAP